MHVEENINQILMMKSFLEAVPDLYRALEPARSELLVKARDNCHPEITCGVLDKILGTIEPDVTYMKSPLDLRNQRTFAVKSGISDMLDVSRQTYKELTEEIHRHVDRVNGMYRLWSWIYNQHNMLKYLGAEAYNVKICLKFDNARKYWFRLNASDFEGGRLPEVFINTIRKKGKIECQTLDLVKLNLRLSDTSNEVVIRSDSVVHDVVEDLRQLAPRLFVVSESVAIVDMMSSFGQLATTRDYVKPVMNVALALKSARHPIIDKVKTHTPPR